jgi:two-component system, LytTR family, response regulator
MKELIRAMIVDDDTASRTILKKFLEVDNMVCIVASVSNAREAMELFGQLHPDVIFLDINMPEEDGIHFATRLREMNALVPIVFTTAYRGYAASVFNLKPLDYLIKPFGLAEVFEVISKIEINLSEHESEGRKLWGEVIANKLKLKTPRGYIFVNQKDVLFFRVFGALTEVHFTNGTKERISYTLKNLYDEIEHLNFLKISRSEIINLGMLDRVETKSDSCVLRCNDKEFKFNVTRNVLRYFEKLNSIRLG